MAASPASNPLILQRSGASPGAGSSATAYAAGAGPASATTSAAGATSGRSTNLALHPLPILNMSEHYTRVRSQAERDDVQVYGILLGTQQGRDVEVSNSFEIVTREGPASTSSSGSAGVAAGPVVDHDLLKMREEQFKQVFPSFEIIGWYSSGPEPTERDMAIHKQLMTYHETLLFVKLSPSHLQRDGSVDGARSDDDLPLYAYETVIEVARKEEQEGAGGASASTTGAGSGGADEEADSMHVLWAPLSYRIETGEAERIAVDHASKPPQTGTGEETTLIANLTTQYNAIKMLSDRVRAVSQYVALVQSGAFPRDHETLRQIRALVSSLPVVGMPELREEIIEEYNDVLLTSYLSSLTQQASNLNELVDKFDVTQEPGASGGPGSSRRLPRLGGGLDSSRSGPGGGNVLSF